MENIHADENIKDFVVKIEEKIAHTRQLLDKSASEYAQHGPDPDGYSKQLLLLQGEISDKGLDKEIRDKYFYALEGLRNEWEERFNPEEKNTEPDEENSYPDTGEGGMDKTDSLNARLDKDGDQRNQHKDPYGMED